jgi:hypothetical protein
MQEPLRSRLIIAHDATSRLAAGSEWLTPYLNLTASGKSRQAITLIRLLIPCLAIMVLGACRSSSNPPANQPSGAANSNALTATSDADLLEQIDVFSTDVGEPGEEAWKQLEAYPRQELIDRLSLVRDASTEDEFIKTNIAFVLCNLDQDYQVNRGIIVSAFNQSPDTADLYEGQIDRLIQRGDKDLLQVLFDIAPRSDGDLSEGLADTFAEQMKTSTEAFLTQLATQPRTTRSQVSDFVNSAASDDDKSMIKMFLKSIPASSPLAGLAKEMLSDLSQVKID